MKMFEQLLAEWYHVELTDEECNGVLKPLLATRVSNNDTVWGPNEWMYQMQSFPVSEGMRLAMLALSWKIALAYKDKNNDRALEWLVFWESLHHVRAEYSKRSGSDEYLLLVRYAVVPTHTNEEFHQWSDWLVHVAQSNIREGRGLTPLVSLMAYYPWLDAMARACPEHFDAFESAIEGTFTAREPATFYSQIQWVVWSLRNRHPNEAYDSNSLLHRLFSEHSLAQLACFWKTAQQPPSSELLPGHIPKIWQRPLFAGCDITDIEAPEWQHAWIEVISTKEWAKRLSFWVTMVRVRRTKCNPPWLARVLEDHPSECLFFETMYSWMSQMPPFIEPTLNAGNVNTFDGDSLKYEYDLARALWSLYNSDARLDVLPLPALDSN